MQKKKGSNKQKNITKLLIFFSIILLISSCIDKEAPDLPNVIITPDTILEISPIDPVSYVITASSEEDLTGFKITSNPSIFIKDSTFENFTHEISVSTKIKLPQILQGLPEDSIVILTFEVSDTENTIQIEKQLKVVRGYIDILSDSTTMTSLPDGLFFYSTSDTTVHAYEEGMDMSNIDLAFIHDYDLGYTLCSPNANIVRDKLLEADIQYDATNKNLTKLTSFPNTYWFDINYKTIYNLSLVEEYVNGDPTNGIGINDLFPSKIIAFETHDQRKGVIQIKSTTKNGKQLEFYIKVQVP